jgi:hypothetical protein
MSMKARKKRKIPAKRQPTEHNPSIRNQPIHIPLTFEQAVDTLLKTKPQKKPRDTSSTKKPST